MSAIQINKDILESHHQNIVMMSGALENIEEQVYHLTDILDDLPPSIKSDIMHRFNQRITGIGSVCHCLAQLAVRESDTVDDWVGWAIHTGVNIEFEVG